MCDLFSRPVPPATKTKAYVIRMLKEDILAHEAMIGHIAENPTYITWYGDEAHHLKWIEVFSNALHYLTKS